jgi:hypothetical protein
MTATTTTRGFEARLEAAYAKLVQVYTDRGNFLSDDDILDATDEFAPLTDEELASDGPLDGSDHQRMIDALYARCSEEDGSARPTQGARSLPAVDALTQPRQAIIRKVVYAELEVRLLTRILAGEATGKRPTRVQTAAAIAKAEALAEAANEVLGLGNAPFGVRMAVWQALDAIGAAALRGRNGATHDRTAIALVVDTALATLRG